MAQINGTASGNRLTGTDADDVIRALAGDDLIIGSGGRDWIDGGAGSDTVDYSMYGHNISVSLKGDCETHASFNGEVRDTLVNVENIIGGNGDDFFAGDDCDNTFRGNGGHDYFLASEGRDTYYGGDGYDAVDYTPIGNGITIKPTSGGYSLQSVFGVVYDRLYSIEIIHGTHKNDVIHGGGANNTLHGNGGNDRLVGGRGGDVLDGGKGNDKLTGGADADIFVFSTGDGRDKITDFDTSGWDADRIDLSGVRSITGFRDLVHNHMWQRGSNVVIDGGDGERIVLKGVDIDDLEASHFIF